MGGNKERAFVAGADKVNIDLIFSGLGKLPEEGHEVMSEGFSLEMGGGIPATLVGLGRLGVPVRVQTPLGDDLFSGFAKDFFIKNGVDVVNLTPDYAGIPLNVTSVQLTPHDRTFVTYSDRREPSGEELELVYQRSTGAKICCMNPVYLPVYKRLKDEGTILVLDTGWDDDMSLESWKPLLELADYYLPNRLEAMKITGADSPEEAAQRLEPYFETVIVKLDADGCLIRERGVQTLVPSVPATDYKDSTGAGDAFYAGFLYGRYHDMSVYDSILCGNLTGGKCVTAIGCLNAWYNEAELLEAKERYCRQ